jgi:hypothetical protein
MAHPWFSALTAGLLAVSMAADGDRTARERAAVAVRTLAGCAAAVVAGGWLMRLIHG